MNQNQSNLDSLTQRLKALSRKYLGLATFFNDEKNGMEIAAVSDLVGNLYELQKSLDNHEVDTNDVDSLKEQFQEENPEAAELIEKCLNTFPESAKAIASIYLDAIKEMYQEAVIEITKKLQDYSSSPRPE